MTLTLKIKLENHHHSHLTGILTGLSSSCINKTDFHAENEENNVYFQIWGFFSCNFGFGLENMFG